MQQDCGKEEGETQTRRTQHMKELTECCCSVYSLSHVKLCDPMDCSPPGSSVPGKNTGVGCHFFLQGIFPSQG